MISTARTRWRVIASCAWALTIGWAAYAFLPILHGFFLSDDFVPLVLFEQWRGEGRLGAMLASKFWTGLDAGGNHFYRPVSYLTFAIHDALSGVDPRGWMWTTVGLHFANAALVAAVALTSTRDWRDARSWAAAALGAGLFLFFAPAVEVAAWISGRFDVMATLFSLASLLAFLRSRRAMDAAWWSSLAAMVAACLSKESAAVLPFAILLHARYVRLAALQGFRAWIPAVRMAAPWLFLAVAYLLARWAMFGSATAVYEDTKPLSQVLSLAKLQELGENLPAYFRAQFPLGHGLPVLVAITLLQAAAVAFRPPTERRARGALLAALGAALVAFLLLVPSIHFSANSGGGRLLYQSTALYAIFIVVALRHARLPCFTAGLALILVVTHAAIQLRVLRVWERAHTQMRAMVGEIQSLDRRLDAGDFALVLVPQSMGQAPFAGNAQEGLMAPPFLPPHTSRHLLVQIYEEVPGFAGKLREGIIPTLRSFSVADYILGKRAPTQPPAYPSVVVCWDAKAARLAPLHAEQFSTASPASWVQDLQSALRTSPCDLTP